jgi:hypothetical protein
MAMRLSYVFYDSRAKFGRGGGGVNGNYRDVVGGMMLKVTVQEKGFAEKDHKLLNN